MRKLMALLLVAGLATTACGGSASTDTPDSPDASTQEHESMESEAKCSPSGTQLTITAQNTAFNLDCLAAPADTAFQITLDNKDDLAHNLAIHEKGQEASPLFAGSTFTGPSQMAYNVPPLKAGNYFFHCQVHPVEMKGSFVVK